LKDCDIIIEAIIENLDEKRTTYKQLDELCKPETIFASNTSSLSITEMMTATSAERQRRFVGLHFFNPVPLMKLVEVVKTILTDEAVYEQCVEFGKSLGKVPVRASDKTGFIVNRLLVPYMLDAIRALEEGVGSIVDIDNAMKLGCGYPMGPFTLGDFVGLDTTYYIAEIMFNEFREKRFAAPPLLKRMVLAGLYGRKSGRGFYDYTKGFKESDTNDTCLVSALARSLIVRIRKMTEANLIVYERDGGRASIFLNRPEKRNALSHQMIDELSALLRQLADDANLRVVILSGTGTAFCSGTDIAELTSATSEQAVAISKRGQNLCDQVENFPVPVVAAINGVAAGGGCELALASHIRFASSAASFSLPEVRLGIIPGYGGTQRLAREIGVGRAVELMLTGKTISANEAV
jgi:3-hydroxybutyryl-CoA dehydrogenase